MLMYSRQSFHPIVSRDQYTTIVFIQRTLNIDPPIHRAVLYRPLYISVYRYIIPNVNPSIMLSGPFHIHIIYKEHNGQVNEFKKLHEQIKTNILNKNMMQG